MQHGLGRSLGDGLHAMPRRSRSRADRRRCPAPAPRPPRAASASAPSSARAVRAGHHQCGRWSESRPADPAPSRRSRRFPGTRCALPHPTGACGTLQRAITGSAPASNDRQGLAPTRLEAALVRRRARAHPPSSAAHLRVGRPAPVRGAARRGGAAGRRREQVQRVRARPATSRAPLVARGSGSGLSGGAMPVEDGCLIALSRLRRILEVDLDNQRVTVEPGVTNIAVSEVGRPEPLLPARSRPARSCARSAATWRRTPAARTASSTASPPTT